MIGIILLVCDIQPIVVEAEEVQCLKDEQAKIFHLHEFSKYEEAMYVIEDDWTLEIPKELTEFSGLAQRKRQTKYAERIAECDCKSPSDCYNM